MSRAVFGSLDMSRSSSMTKEGQCRLAPLIPCIQDSIALYNHSMKIMFRLHSSELPALWLLWNQRNLAATGGIARFAQYIAAGLL